MKTKNLFLLSALFPLNVMLNAQSMRSTAPVKRVLLEEFTTCSCGNCPMTSFTVNKWRETHPDAILMTIHEGSGEDGMSSATAKTIFNAMHPNSGWFAPAIMINRGVYSIDPEAYMTANDFGSSATPKKDSIALRLLSEAPVVGVDISGTYNSTTRVINASVNVNFVTAVTSADWRINLFLVEDSVIGTPHLGAFAGGYDQHCYDTPWANSHFPGMFDGTSIIGYPHRHVMRNALLGDWGAASVIPSTPMVGNNYSKTATFTIPTTYKEKDLTLVAFVSMYTPITNAATHTANIGKNYILNANEVKLSSTFVTSAEESFLADQASIDNLYPMPSTGETRLVYTLNKPNNIKITLTDMLGQTVKVLSPGNHASAGINEIVFNVNDLPQGMYYITLATLNGNVVRKLIVD